MDLRHLRYFAAVAEEGGFVRAARRMHISQPSLSRQVRALEEDLGAPLLERGTTGVRATAAGAAVLEAARAASAALAEGVRHARLAERGAFGTCVLGVGRLVMAAKPIGDLVTDLRASSPDLRLVIREVEVAGRWDALRRGDFDAAIWGGTPLDEDWVGSEPIFGDSVTSALVAADGPLATVDEADPAVLVKEPVQLPRLTGLGAVWPQVRAFFVAATGCEPRVEEHDNYPSIWASVAAGRGWTPVPSIHASHPFAGTTGVRVRGLAIPLSFRIWWNRLAETPIVRNVVGTLLKPGSSGAGASSPRSESAGTDDRPPHGIELRHLRAFHDVCDEGGLGHAAERLGLTASGVARQIRSLEREIGAPLFKRTAGAFELTAAGKVFASAAARVAEALDDLPTKARVAAGLPDPGMTLAVVLPAIAAGIVGEATELMRKRRPQTSIKIADLATPLQAAAVASRAVDAGISHVYPGVIHDARIQRTRLADDVIDSALISVDHPFAARERLRAPELADVPLIFVARSFHPPLYDALTGALAALGLVPRDEGTQESLGAVWSLVAHGLGWGFGTRSQRSRPPPGTKAVPIEGLALPWGLDLLSRAGESRPAVLDFLACVREAARAQSAVSSPLGGPRAPRKKRNGSYEPVRIA
jgi:DNA-binding transcriptional LysR family regulator